MRGHILRVLIAFCVSAFVVVTARAQQGTPDAPPARAAQAQANASVVEGTVVSTTTNTLVIRTDDDQYHLFTYGAGAASTKGVKPGARVRVNVDSPDGNGTQVAESIDVTQPSSPATGGTTAQAAPPPPSVNHATNSIEGDARRWHAGGRIGVGFSPEIFLFGVQSQIGPFFSPHLIFRPNAEFGFGELTDMFAINLEAAYRMKGTFRGQWVPYFGMGPSLNFIHQGASSGDTSFSDFDYKTGFNVFVGGQRKKTFVEMKTSLWSGKAPVLRLLVGYNF